MGIKESVAVESTQGLLDCSEKEFEDVVTKLLNDVKRINFKKTPDFTDPNKRWRYWRDRCLHYEGLVQIYDRRCNRQQQLIKAYKKL